jgi:hypothetical protein
MKEKVIEVGSGAGRVKYIIWYDLEKEWRDRYVIVKIKYYPTEYGNYVETRVTVNPWKKGGICVNVDYIRQNWNGTGADNILTVCYDVDAEEIPILEDPTMIESIQTEKDVYKLLEWILDDLETIPEIFKKDVLGKD